MSSYLEKLLAVAQGSQEILDKVVLTTIKLVPMGDEEPARQYSGRWGETIMFAQRNLDERMKDTVRQAYLAIGGRQLVHLRAEICKAIQVPEGTPLPSVVEEILIQVPERFADYACRLIYGDLSDPLPTEAQWEAMHPNYQEVGFSHKGVHAAGMTVMLYTGSKPGVTAGLDVLLHAVKLVEGEEPDTLTMEVLDDHLLRV